MTHIEAGKLNELRKRLETRAVELRDEIRATVQKSDQEKQDLLRDQVRDPGEDSFLDLVSDVNNADVQRDVGEFRAVTAALSRMNNGEYGSCADCGREIGLKRLEAQPFSTRCIDCQERHERLTADGRAPTL